MYKDHVLIGSKLNYEIVNREQPLLIHHDRHVDQM